MSTQVHRFADPAAAADALAARIATDLGAALDTAPRALLLVSGGRSPIGLFAALAVQELAWDRIDVSLVDERSVSPDGADANAGLVRQHLLVGAARAARWIALMPPALFAAAAGPREAAEQAATRACAEPALAAAAVIVLGIGTDGHTASLFVDAPQWEHARTTAARYVALEPRLASHPRVSLSLHALRTQGRCYLWAVGHDKLQTIERLQALTSDLEGNAEDGEKLAAAGPVASLIAAPEATLQVYYSDAV